MGYPGNPNSPLRYKGERVRLGAFGACMKCWKECGQDQDKYDKMMAAKRTQGPVAFCTPEEQAGPEAGQCPWCGHQTIHEKCGVCMNPDCRYGKAGPGEFDGSPAELAEARENRLTRIYELACWTASLLPGRTDKLRLCELDEAIQHLEKAVAPFMLAAIQFKAKRQETNSG